MYFCRGPSKTLGEKKDYLKKSWNLLRINSFQNLLLSWHEGLTLSRIHVTLRIYSLLALRICNITIIRSEVESRCSDTERGSLDRAERRGGTMAGRQRVMLTPVTPPMSPNKFRRQRSLDDLPPSPRPCLKRESSMTKLEKWLSVQNGNST